MRGVRGLNFGGTRPGTRWQDDLLRGFNVREGFWGITTEVHHQLTRRASLVVGYYHNFNFNPTVTDNLLVAPADYSPFSITAPVDARLPGGGGYAVTGLYDLAPAQVGRVDNLVRKASDFGRNRTLTNDFLSINVNTRFSDFELGGGIDSGLTVLDICFVVDSPQLVYCRDVTRFKDQMQVKMYASYPLPLGFQASFILNNLGGAPILANFTVTRAQIEGLGRPLSTSSRAVPLIEPHTQYEPRTTQLDVQLKNTIRLGRYQLKPSLGLYNVLNSSGTLAFNPTYGPTWRPTTILGGRVAQVSAEVRF